MRELVLQIIICINFTGDVRRINYWYIDDVKLFYNATGIESIYNLTIDKPNAKLSTNGNLTVKNDLIIKPGSYFTNGINNTLNVMGTAFLEADNTGIASFIDNGTSTFSNCSNRATIP